jgi:hypothetical protein
MQEQKRGGARKGAGRKHTGRKTIRMQFSITKENAELLKNVPNKSAFVNAAIQAGFKTTQRKGNQEK